MSSHRRGRLSRLVLAVLLLLPTLYRDMADASDGDARAELATQVFQIHNRSAESMEASIRFSMSPDGSLQLNKRSNTIAVRDHPENLRRIAALIKMRDGKPEKIRMTIDVIEKRHLRGVASGFWEAARDGFLLATGRFNRNSGTWKSSSALKLALDPESRHSAHYSRQYVIVENGSPARVTLSRTVPLAEWFHRYSLKRGFISNYEGFQDLATGFYVRPNLLTPKRLHLTITPRIAYSTANREATIAYKESETALTVDTGMTVAIGRDLNENNGLIYNIFGGLPFTERGTELVVLVTLEVYSP